MAVVRLGAPQVVHHEIPAMSFHSGFKALNGGQQVREIGRPVGRPHVDAPPPKAIRHLHLG